jgi:hypothetical protein
MSTQPKTRTVSPAPKVKPGNSVSRRKTSGRNTAKLPGEPELVIDTSGPPPILPNPPPKPPA